MSDYLSADELAAWQRLQQVTERLRLEVGRGLRADGSLSEPEFTVLAHLVDQGGEARPAECASAIGWDSSRLAHQLGRLERRGFVTRSRTVGRGRAAIISLTPAGVAAHRHAVGPHLRAAKQWFADALDEQSLRGLTEALDRMDAHIAARQARAGDRDTG